MPNINDYGLPFTSQDGDRKYSALEWREYFSRLIHNGLIQNAANECQVKPQAAPNKTVYVDTGVVFINGAMRVLEEPVTLAVTENTSGNPRIDRVVARLNEASRTIEFAVLEGTPAVSPVAPDLTRTEGVYELGLADITLANGYSTITSGVINDKRWDVSLCGASSMTIGVIPPSGLEAETVILGDENKEILKVNDVDSAFHKMSNMELFTALVSNVNSKARTCAFLPFSRGILQGKFFGLGFQIARYFEGYISDYSLTSEETRLLEKQSDFYDVCENCKTIIAKSTQFVSLVNTIPFASYVYNNYFSLVDYKSCLTNVNSTLGKNYPSIGQYKTDPDAMVALMGDSTLCKNVRWCNRAEKELFGDNGEFLELLSGSGNFMVPEGVTTLYYSLVSNGSGTNTGKILNGALAVTPGENIVYSIGLNTTFGGLTTASGSAISNSNAGLLLRASNGGNGNGSAGEYGGGSGGGGGYGAGGGLAGQGAVVAGGPGGVGFGAGGGGGKATLPGGAGGIGFEALGASTSIGGASQQAGVKNTVVNFTDADINIEVYRFKNYMSASPLFIKADSKSIWGGGGGGGGVNVAVGTAGAAGAGGAAGGGKGANGTPAGGVIMLFW